MLEFMAWSAQFDPHTSVPAHFRKEWEARPPTLLEAFGGHR